MIYILANARPTIKSVYDNDNCFIFKLMFNANFEYENYAKSLRFKTKGDKGDEDG